MNGEITPEKAAAELWLRAWLDRHGDNPGFDAVMAVIRDGAWTDGDDMWPCTGQYSYWGPCLHFDGTDAHGDIPAEFWDHVEVYLGHPIPPDERAEGFSCSC